MCAYFKTIIIRSAEIPRHSVRSPAEKSERWISSMIRDSSHARNFYPSVRSCVIVITTAPHLYAYVSPQSPKAIIVVGPINNNNKNQFLQSKNGIAIFSQAKKHYLAKRARLGFYSTQEALCCSLEKQKKTGEANVRIHFNEKRQSHFSLL